MKKVLIVLSLIVILVGGIYFLAGPNTVLNEDLELAGLGAMSKYFQVSGFRNQMHIKIIIQGSGSLSALNVTIQDPSGNNIYSIQDNYGDNTYYINATIGLKSMGKYKISLIFIGDLKVKITVKAYNGLLDFLVSKE